MASTRIAGAGSGHREWLGRCRLLPLSQDRPTVPHLTVPVHGRKRGQASPAGGLRGNSRKEPFPTKQNRLVRTITSVTTPHRPRRLRAGLAPSSHSGI